MKILNKAAGVAGRHLRPAEGVATNAVGARGRVASLSSFVFYFILSENKTSLPLPLSQKFFIQQKVLDADVLNALFVNPRFNVIFDHHNFFE